MAKLRDLTGQKFGRLKVIERSNSNKRGRALWLCECECGKIKVISGTNLISNHTQSCGCLLMESRYKHGYEINGNVDRLYSIWRHMIERCYNENVESYKNYGGRGITVCEEWKNDIESFRKWAIENGYAENLTLDRKENDKGYSPDNCRWADLSMQANNRRSNVLIEYNGETKTLMQWCRELGISFSTTQNRLNLGWSVERAFNEPVHTPESGVKGVQIRKDGKSIRYRPFIYVNKKRICLGTYKNLEDAVSARREAEEKYYGKKGVV